MPCTLHIPHFISQVQGEAGGYRLTVGRLVQGNTFLRAMHYVYVLLSEKDKNFYIGFSENINQRLDEHNAGKKYKHESSASF
jgi:hypothetical protein